MAPKKPLNPPTPPKHRKLVPPKVAAAMLGVSVSYLARNRSKKSGVIPYHKLSTRTVRYDVEEMMEDLEHKRFSLPSSNSAEGSL